MASTVVTTFAELKTAAQNPDIDTVYVNADITLESGGILLSKNKPGLIIDCLYPQDETGTVHRMIDRMLNLQSDSIRIAAEAGSYHLTLRNCIFIGRTYYGALSCMNSSVQGTTTLTLENVDYSGPQAAYNRYGTVELIGGNYRIGPYNDSTAAVNETVEANIVVLEGNVNIHHDGTPNSCFFLSETAPQFIIRERANVSIETTGREVMYCDTSLSFIQEPNSRFYAKPLLSLLYFGQYARNITIGENAELIFEQKSRYYGVATVQCSGNFTALPGSRIIIKRTFSANEPLISFNTTATAEFSDPDTVILYNPDGRVFHWSAGTGTLKINADNINYWTSAADLSIAGTFDDPPVYNWFKKDNSFAEITATLSSASMTSVTTNIIQDVDAPVIPTTTSFNIQNARVLSYGRLPLTLNEIRDMDTSITGTTAQEAAVRSCRLDVCDFTVADENSRYLFTLASPAQKSDLFSVSANKEFKFKYISTSAQGSLSFLSIPERLPFCSVALPVRRAVFTRKNRDWAIVVRDTRENGRSWSVYANAPLPLSNGAKELSGALVFAEGTAEQSIEGANAVKIFTGTGNRTISTDTTICWNDVEGLLLNLIPDFPYSGGHYETPIVFTLTEDEDDGN